jgi:hypothetical protein
MKKKVKISTYLPIPIGAHIKQKNDVLTVCLFYLTVLFN